MAVGYRFGYYNENGIWDISFITTSTIVFCLKTTLKGKIMGPLLCLGSIISKWHNVYIKGLWYRGQSGRFQNQRSAVGKRKKSPVIAQIWVYKHPGNRRFELDKESDFYRTIIRRRNTYWQHTPYLGRYQLSTTSITRGMLRILVDDTCRRHKPQINSF